MSVGRTIDGLFVIFFLSLTGILIYLIARLAEVVRRERREAM